MREILLRSYDENIGCFYYFKDGKYYADLEFEVEMYSEVFNWNNAEYFTGLLDKNSNKVFEGDRVLYDGIIGVVFYNSGICMYMVRFELSRSIYSFDSLDREIEIIGNIQENEKSN